MTAAELMAQLEQDPAFKEGQARRELDRAETVARFRDASAPVLDDLRSIGVTPTSLGTLASEYPPLSQEIVDVLLRWISRTDDPDLLESLVRALAASEVVFDGKPLAQAFENSKSDTLRWAIANTMAEALPTSITDWIIRALQTPGYGEARQMLPLALARLASSRTANEVLISVFAELPGHVALALAESGGEAELKFLRVKRAQYAGWIRKEIDNAVRAITKRLAQNPIRTNSIS